MSRTKMFYTNSTLPKGLAFAISNLYTGRKYSKAMKLVDVIYSSKYLYPSRDMSEFVPIPTDYIYKVITMRHSKILADLLNESILERKGVASVAKHKCYEYRFASPYRNSPLENISYMKPIDNTLEPNSDLINMTLKNLNMISLPCGISVEQMIEARIPQIQKSASRKSDKPEEIKNIVDRVVKVETSYLNNLKEGNFRASISPTNLRLDHSLTNLCNQYVNQLQFQNEPMLSIDLINSQSCILANLIYSSLDENLIHGENELINVVKNRVGIDRRRIIYYHKLVSNFCEASFQGRIYEEIMHQGGFQSRSSAKSALFEAMYSTIGLFKESENKLKFRTSFPEIVNILDDYKTKHIETQKKIYLKNRSSYKYRNNYKCYSQVGSSKLAVYLQKAESDIFVNCIYRKLNSMNVPTISKHDALLVPLSMKAKALEVIQGELNNSLVYGYSLKVEKGGETLETIISSPTRRFFINEPTESMINSEGISLLQQPCGAF